MLRQRTVQSRTVTTELRRSHNNVLLSLSPITLIHYIRARSTQRRNSSKIFWDEFHGNKEAKHRSKGGSTRSVHEVGNLLVKEGATISLLLKMDV